MPDESPAKRKIDLEDSTINAKLKRTKSIGHEDLTSSILAEVKRTFEDRIAKLESRVEALEEILKVDNKKGGKQEKSIEVSDADTMVDNGNRVEQQEQTKSKEEPPSKHPPALPPRNKEIFGKGGSFQFKKTSELSPELGVKKNGQDCINSEAHKEPSSSSSSSLRSIPISSKPVFGATTSFGNMAKNSNPLKTKLDINSSAATAAAPAAPTAPAAAAAAATETATAVASTATAATQNSAKFPVPGSTFKSTFGSKSRFGNAFQESLKQKSFLDNTSDTTTSIQDKTTRPDSKDELQTTTTTQQFQQVDLNPVEQSTGEEDEKSLFTSNAKLFELNLSKISEGWKERGVGPLHLNQSQKDKKLVRIVMRSQGLLRVILNYKIQVDTAVMKGLEASLSPGKYFRLNSINSEGQPIQYLIKLANEKLRDELINEIDKLKLEMK
ncbi:hypothetical protein KGF56_003524 [Candida oxycetoniae]|uniref:RanBD1 domain-containing protein n=1 Tax=Candida oxycetoniae TaxID=497107 RepID=A0AAI9SVY9_9ASCO|nr:uncharacterized protein KGF56_003524 [Candida oxycetoniae]KAI3403706.2 hypothetical protein KGF56_003524 [Candida oxycetoniae]